MKNFFASMGSSMKGSKGILTFVAVVVFAVVGWNFLNTPEVASNPSSVSSDQMNQETVQGTANPITEEYSNALNEADRQRLIDARENNTSAMPTIQNTTTETNAPLLILPDNINSTPDINVPKNEIVQQPIIIQQPITATVPFVTAPPPAPVIATPEQVRSMVTAMQRRPLAVAEVIDFSPNDPVVETVEQSSPVFVSDVDTVSASQVTVPLAGSIIYAELVGRANSDNPGPVLARILQGEYTGATLIGTFQTTRNALVINFDRMSVQRSRSGDEINEVVPIQAVAVDTKYIGTGLATSVNRRIFQKLAIAFTAGFAEGLGSAISSSGNTSIDTSNGTVTTGTDLDTDEQLLSAGGQAVSEAGSILTSEFGNVPTTIIVEGGTPIGILFL